MDTFHRITAEGFSYTGVSNLKLNKGFVSTNNAAVYTIGNGKIGTTDHSMVFRMNQAFEVQWERCVEGLVTHESMTLTQDESAVILVPYKTSN